MNLSNKRDLTIFLSQLARKRRKELSIPEQVRLILSKYNATMLLPGVSGAMRFGYRPGNYRESTGQTLAAADQQVGLVVDAGGGAIGSDAVFNGGFSAGSDGWSGASGFSFATGSLTIVASGGGTTNNSGESAVAGALYYCEVVVSSRSSGAIRLVVGGTNGTTISASGTHGFYVQATNTNKPVLNCVAGGTSLVVTRVSVKPVSGIHASQSTSGFQPVLRNSGGIQSWQFDGEDDRFIMTFAAGAGWNSTTIITARSTGAVTETGQNVEGTHLFQASGHVYVRFYIPNGSTVSAGDLATLQKFANVLSGYSA